MADDRGALASKIREARAYADCAGFALSTICLTEQQTHLVLSGLAALRSDAGAEMREAAARLADDQAVQDRAAEAAHLPPDPASSDCDASLMFAGHAAAMEILARDIRALPLTPTEDGRDALC